MKGKLGGRVCLEFCCIVAQVFSQPLLGMLHAACSQLSCLLLSGHHSAEGNLSDSVCRSDPLSMMRGHGSGHVDSGLLQGMVLFGLSSVVVPVG